MGLEVVVPGLIAFDPGKSTGWARFENLALVACGTFNPELHASPPFAVHPEDWIVIERPRVQGNRVPADDIITLGIRAGLLAGRFYRAGLHWVEVGEWKGQLPKAICHSRIAGALTTQEREIVKGQKHDTWDAVGIGLWAYNRFRC